MLYLRPDFASTLSPAERRFSHLFQLTGQIYRAKDGRKTLRFQHHSKNYFLKAHNGVGWKEILKNIIQLRLPVISANPEWCALHRLKELNIDTTTPVAYGSEGLNPARRHSFIITEELSDTVTLEEILLQSSHHKTSASLPLWLKRSLVKRVAEIARTMHENGINHRDFYLCHLRLPVSQLGRAASTQPLPVYVMDLHRAQVRRRRPRERWIVKDLAGLYFSSMDLGLSRHDRFRFIATYSGRSLRDTLVAGGLLWEKVGTRAMRLYRKHHVV
jgi:heptose I phosphotransferase